ncbi:MAG TPA: ABC transporter ATP-binding protein [Deltaproteobacteria bacterium]|nr:ABC transporter ATP-binding protein [Deltaproteobacteria bacterium]HPJ94910.1 ABC transporter ATP-binding protein [Deltaproteobacteria bacterium]HPR52570.1 ABC transporter ATP-binding protein [Deltaproteobacteria bacterium]
MAPLLNIENLHISYGAIKALKGISLTLDEGEIVTVLGANGAGKSTLMEAISGLVPIEKGTIMVAGEVLNKIPAYEIVLKGVSLSPEGRRVFPTLTVDENLRLGAYTMRSRKKEVGEAKDRVFSLFPILAERHRQLAGTLSGGEQQMLAIGRALMSTPRILLLDEPSLGLAPILVKQIFNIIEEINNQGTTILLVEQNANKALGVANRGYVLENGTITTSGSSAELKTNKKVQEAYLGGSALKKRRG